jgi:hypothetical protein
MNQTVTLTFTLEEIQVLNNILQNSAPTVAFGIVSKFVTGINQQIQGQLQKNEQENLPKQMKAVTRGDVEIPKETPLDEREG